MPGDEISPKTFVLVHGAWHGGWCWREVADLLLGRGHRVFAPTLTGLGERRHLMSPDISLATFVADVAGVIEVEELGDLILVGHSHGGAVISGVADAMPERIRALVYLDATILQNGESAFGVLPAEVVAERRRKVLEAGGIAMPVPEVTAFGVPADHPRADWVRRRLTPHPVGSYESPLALSHPVGNGRPSTYISCTDPLYLPMEPARAYARQAGWTFIEMPTGHDAMVLQPEALAGLLEGVG
ncbi:alpha/beta hydrolase [Xanthobacter sp. 126]|uniref:alpha/beta fold hydrolase n=1 Tax=Xanthobacter sp. 126 TaxID=1131814 RepID=UPI00045E99B1|nr:alpha/beta hydrolase [Xanthobacter sp. 126]